MTWQQRAPPARLCTPVAVAKARIKQQKLAERIEDTKKFLQDEKAKREEWDSICKAQTKRWLTSRGKLIKPPGLCTEVKEQILEWFELVDDDGSGGLELEELTDALTASGIPCDPKSIIELVNLVDLNHDGCIDWEEFELFLSNEYAAGKSLMDGEYVLPSGQVLPFGSMISKLRRNKIMADVMEGGEGRKELIKKADELALNSRLKKKTIKLPQMTQKHNTEEELEAMQRRRLRKMSTNLVRRMNAITELQTSGAGRAGSPELPLPTGTPLKSPFHKLISDPPPILAPGGQPPTAKPPSSRRSPLHPPTLPKWLIDEGEDSPGKLLTDQLSMIVQTKIEGKRRRKRRIPASNPKEMYGWSDCMTYPSRRGYKDAAQEIKDYRVHSPYIPPVQRGALAGLTASRMGGAARPQ